MRNIIYSLGALVLLLAMPSCRKCITCQATDSSGTVIYSQSTCGGRIVRNANESDCKTEASQYGGSCNCTND
ncbi:MAG: hypothetical protein H6594_12855 [Flavobacteriales bacterium]|nr:hypothetical protein [Flavobacteriales bacterium]